MSPTLLPLFPLPLVLLPGARLPLHIFEPRYRRLLGDCLQGSREFGIVFRPVGAEERPPVGLVGCRAHVDEVEMLPDGRSNILVAGTDRFRLVELAESDHPYAVGAVEPHVDLVEDAGKLAVAEAAVRELFARVAQAAGTIAERPIDASALPDGPARLSFGVAAAVDLEPELRQELLASRSPLERLVRLGALLAAAVAPAEERARVHARSKSNGRGPHPT